MQHANTKMLDRNRDVQTFGYPYQHIINSKKMHSINHNSPP
jgi:hypothetical protein